ncbi:MAG: hypothetical protein RIQ89_1300 [Bacteroidota bacterium]|jgi:FkbM family methyltransferase
MNLLEKILYRIVKGSNPIFQSLCHQHRNHLVTLDNEFPSLLHNGYRHLDEATKLINKYNIQHYPILDVGASIGDTLSYLSPLLPNSVFHCFEPTSQSFLHLQSLAKKYPKCKVYQKACGAQPGKAIIYLNSRTSSSSLLPTNVTNADDYLQQSLNTHDSEEIEVTTLDTLFQQEKVVALLKLDVQGFELEVLKGAVKVLKNTAIVVTEMNNHDYYNGACKYYEVDEFIRQNGLTFFRHFPTIRENGQVVEWDNIYINPNIIKP